MHNKKARIKRYGLFLCGVLFLFLLGNSDELRVGVHVMPGAFLLVDQ